MGKTQISEGNGKKDNNGVKKLRKWTPLNYFTSYNHFFSNINKISTNNNARFMDNLKKKNWMNMNEYSIIIMNQIKKLLK